MAGKIVDSGLGQNSIKKESLLFLIQTKGK